MKPKLKINLRHNTQSGFTLIELLVVITIIGLLASIILVSFSNARWKARDARRLADMRQIQTALDLYFDKFGQYPDAVSDAAPFCLGWDTPADGSFLASLVTENFLKSSPKDPIQTSSCGNYFYYRYDTETWPANGCNPAKGDYYVLAILNLDSTTGVHPNSPGFTCSGRNWQTLPNDFYEWVTGQYER